MECPNEMTSLSRDPLGREFFSLNPNLKISQSTVGSNQMLKKFSTAQDYMSHYRRRANHTTEQEYQQEHACSSEPPIS